LRPLTYPALFIIIFLLLSAPVLAGSDSNGYEGQTSWGWYRSFKILFDEGTACDIEYDVEVLDGPPVDVIFTTEEGFLDYKDPESETFFYYPHQSVLNTTKTSMSFTWVEPGTYYLIVDNSLILNEAIIEEANVTLKGGWSYETQDTWVDLCMWLVVAAMVLGVVASVYIGVRNRHKRKEIMKKAHEDPNFLRDLVIAQRSPKLDGEKKVNMKRIQMVAEGDPELRAEIQRLEEEMDQWEADRIPPRT
jgi:hypothetical protein